MKITPAFFLFLHFTICVFSSAALHFLTPLSFFFPPVVAGAIYCVSSWLLVKATFKTPNRPMSFWNSAMIEALIVVFAAVTIPTIYAPNQGSAFAIPFILMHQFSTLKLLEWEYRL